MTFAEAAAWAHQHSTRQVAERIAMGDEPLRRWAAAVASGSGVLPACRHRTRYGCCGSPVRLDCRLHDRDVAEADCRGCPDATA